MNNVETDNKHFKGAGAFDAFLNLLSLISLAWVSWATGSIAFQLANKFLAGTNDLARMTYTAVFSEQSVKYAIASLIILTPIYFVAVNVLHKNYKDGKLNHQSGVYRWLTYLMLLISALSIIGSLVALIFGFLNGDYTSVVVVKILTVLIIASLIFSYYFYDLRRKDYNKKDKISIIFGSAVGVIIVILLIAGVMVIDSPTTVRLKMTDNLTVQNLESINNMLNQVYSMDKKLPDDMNSTRYQSILANANRDASKISYRKINDSEFELCADFLVDISKEQNATYYNQASWYAHGSGHQCFNQKPAIAGDIKGAPGVQEFPNPAPVVNQ